MYIIYIHVLTGLPPVLVGYMHEPGRMSSVWSYWSEANKSKTIELQRFL